jgi:ankyrin repeat protein
LRNNIGESPLCVASKEGHYDIVKCLLRSGVDSNLRDTFLGESPLCIASRLGHYNGDSPILLRNLISAPDLNKHS